MDTELIEDLNQTIEENTLLEYSWHFFVFVIIFLITILVAKLFRRFFNKFILKSTVVMRNNPTGYQFVKHLGTALIYITGIGIAIQAIPPLRTLSASLLAGAGILAVAIGFASQSAFSNIISGLFIVIFRPFRVNDRITIEDTFAFGIVEDITLRHTVIRNPENKRIIIPNSLISNKVVVNSDLVDGKICRFVEVGVGYNADIDKVRQVLTQLIVEHPLCIDNRTAEDIANGLPQVRFRVISLGDFAVTVRAWAWTNNAADSYELVMDMNELILKRFREENIEIPYPHRVVIQKQ